MVIIDDFFGKKSILCSIAPWLPDAFWKMYTMRYKMYNFKPVFHP